jgi:hypothetical protein
MAPPAADDAKAEDDGVTTRALALDLPPPRPLDLDRSS